MVRVGVAPLLTLKPLVVLQGQPQKPPAHAPRPRLVEQVVLVDMGAERVNRLHRMAEIGLSLHRVEVRDVASQRPPAIAR